MRQQAEEHVVEARSEALRRRAHELIPGGCHTYAKGDDQFPEQAPPFIARGEGAASGTSMAVSSSSTGWVSGR